MTTEWQPIATAKKIPWKSVLLALKDGQVCEGYYGKYNSGWYQSGSDECAVKPIEPTHWMPLPSPPAAGE